jgi:hypothetical protein
LIALPLIGTGLCVEASWSEGKRAISERAKGDMPVASMFAVASVLDGVNAVVSLVESGIIWKHHISEHRHHETGTFEASDCDVSSAVTNLPTSHEVLSWTSIEAALQWADVNPYMVFAGPTLAVAATAAAIAAEVMCEIHAKEKLA